jgi:transposase
VIRFNKQSPEGLTNKSAPGAPGKLRKRHKAFLARPVEEGPIPAIHGVVRWRALDLIMRLHEEFGISVSDRVYRTLKKLGLADVSARPKAYKHDAEAVYAFKKLCPRVAEVRAKLAPGNRWARKGSRPRASHDQRTESTYLFGAVCPACDTGAALALPTCTAM